jgi:hypothetical protein
MVKRKKKTSIKRRITKASASVKRRTKRIGSAFKPMKAYAGGFGYGIFRGKASSFVNTSIAPRIPFGNYSDEVAFTGISYLMAKYGKKVLGVDMKKLGRDGLVVEGALMGAQASEMIPMNFNSLGNLFGNSAPAKTTQKAVGYAS